MRNVENLIHISQVMNFAAKAREIEHVHHLHQIAKSPGCQALQILTQIILLIPL